MTSASDFTIVSARDIHDDFILERRLRYVAFLRERVPVHLALLTKKDAEGNLLPLGVLPLTPRQEYLMLRELARGATLVAQGKLEPNPRIAAFMADVNARARLEELHRGYSNAARDATAANNGAAPSAG